MTQLEWHKRIAKALDQGVTNPNFFLWLNVEVEPGILVDEQLITQIVNAVQQWLDSLDPDLKIDPDGSHPTRALQAGPVAVRITALPRKPEARGASGVVVGNPSPPSAYWI
jgi:hypothetical protein